MKKIFLILISLCLLTLSYISLCEEENTKILNMEDVNKKDLQYMKDTYKKEYRWYSCSILLKDYLDAENNKGEIELITNIFMIKSNENSNDVNILLIRHTLKEDTITNIPSMMIEEDVPIKEHLVNIKFEDAFKKALTTKPILHTKHVILRKHLGPLDINPQYTFGNNKGLIFIDADNGFLNYEQPAFRGTGFQTWYGEWPN